MSGTTQSLLRKISSASDLHGIVRSMKALALSNISQFEQAVEALNAYAEVIETGLGACFRAMGPVIPLVGQGTKSAKRQSTYLVFGSDHGLVGQFNDIAAVFARDQIRTLKGSIRIQAVGDRVGNRLASLDIQVSKVLAVPHSVSAIVPLIGAILAESGAEQNPASSAELHVIYNQPTFGTSYEPVIQQILPFDDRLVGQWLKRDWPTIALPQIVGPGLSTTSALIREFLFVTLYRACALSLASENASRLAAMQRADQNIDDLMGQLQGEYHGLRQREIDNDLFDIIAGYESIRGKNPTA